jgi:hypothetical protein
MRRTLIIATLIFILLLLLLGAFTLFSPSSQTLSNTPGLLPKILSKIIPGGKDSKLGDALTDTITIPDLANDINPDTKFSPDNTALVIDDTNLVQGNQNITTIQSTVAEMKTKLEDTQKKVTAYNDYKKLIAEGYNNQPRNKTTGIGAGIPEEGERTVEFEKLRTRYKGISPYGDAFETELLQLEYDIIKYTRLITFYEQVVDRFQKSMVYYYCNGYTSYTEGDRVDTSRLAQNIIVIYRANGSVEQISCGWKGIPTPLPSDSPFHPKNFLAELTQITFKDAENLFSPSGERFSDLNPFKKTNWNYITEDNWNDLPLNGDKIKWTQAPPVWNYYLSITLEIFINFSFDFSIDISRYYTDYFTLYPVDDISEHQSVTIWLDRYLSYRYQDDFYLTGRINTGNARRPVCASVRLGIPKKQLDRAVSTDRSYLTYAFDSIEASTMRVFPLTFEETTLDSNGNETTKKLNCIKTKPGEWQVFRITVKGINAKEPYLFDIIDSNYSSYRMDTFARILRLMKYRYWGPQPLSNLDTLTPQFHLSYTPIITKEDKLKAGLLTVSGTETYATLWTPNTTDASNNPTGTVSLVFKALVHDDRRVNVISNPIGLNQEIQIACNTALPNVVLVHYAQSTSDPDEDYTERVLRNPVLSYGMPNTDPTKASDSTFECTYIYPDLKVRQNDIFIMYNSAEQTNLYGPVRVGDVGGYARGTTVYEPTPAWGKWWMYKYKDATGKEQFSSKYPNGAVCEEEAKKQFPIDAPSCFPVNGSLIAFSLDIGNSVLTDKEGKLTFLVRGDGIPVIPVLIEKGKTPVSAETPRIIAEQKEKRIIFPITITQGQGATEYRIQDSLSGSVLYMGTYDPSRQLIQMRAASFAEFIKPFTRLIESISAPEKTDTAPVPGVVEKPPATYPNILGIETNSIGTFVEKIAKIIPYLMGFWVVLAVAFTGLKVMFFASDKSAIDSFKEGAKYTALGIALLAICWILFVSLDSVLKYLGGK